MAVYDALALRLIDEEQIEYVRVAEGVPVERELESFMTRRHGYERGWVKVRDGERYVRYDRIASVSIVRGLDDETSR